MTSDGTISGAFGAPAPPLLLRGATVLTLDAAARVLVGDVLVVAGRIAAVGPAIAAPPGARVLELGGALLLPGFVQGHLHLGQTLFRGLAEGRRLLAWLRERIWPLEAAHDDDSAYWSGLLGAAECLLGGTTTIQDIGIGNGIRGLVAATRASRLRGFVGMCLMDRGEGAPAALLGTTDGVLAETEALGDELAAAGGDGRLRWVLNPRFILSCSDPLWDGIRTLAERHRWPVHTHALEQEDETAAVRALYGRDEIEVFTDNGILAHRLRIAHGVWIDPRHRPRLRDDGCSVVHCPSSNLKLGSGIADVAGLRAAGIAVGIGADGAACCNTLDALEEVRLAALLRSLRAGPAAGTGLESLRLATSEGARALGLEAEVGSIEAGKRADLVVLALDRPELAASPAVDPHDLVVFGASRASVRHVFLDGEQLVEDGGLRHLDLPAIHLAAAHARERLLVRAGLA